MELATMLPTAFVISIVISAVFPARCDPLVFRMGTPPPLAVTPCPTTAKIIVITGRPNVVRTGSDAIGCVDERGGRPVIYACVIIPSATPKQQP